MADFNDVVQKYKNLPGGIIEAYHAIQKEYNYLPEEAIQAAAQAFGLTMARAYGVATFYSMFSVKPRGRNIIRICESAPCHVAGADKLLADLQEQLGIKVGETTPDGRFTLELSQCVGQCQSTPVITINGKPYEGVNSAKLADILAEWS